MKAVQGCESAGHMAWCHCCFRLLGHVSTGHGNYQGIQFQEDSNKKEIIWLSNFGHYGTKMVLDFLKLKDRNTNHSKLTHGGGT